MDPSIRSASTLFNRRESKPTEVYETKMIQLVTANASTPSASTTGPWSLQNSQPLPLGAENEATKNRAYLHGTVALTDKPSKQARRNSRVLVTNRSGGGGEEKRIVSHLITNSRA